MPAAKSSELIYVHIPGIVRLTTHPSEPSTISLRPPQKSQTLIGYDSVKLGRQTSGVVWLGSYVAMVLAPGEGRPGGHKLLDWQLIPPLGF